MSSSHRHAYESLVGPIPGELTIDHLCRVRCCVNPDHLEPVTRGENVRRGEAGRVVAAMHRAKTHCPHGHPYDARSVEPRGWRRCRSCRRLIDQRRWRAKHPRLADV